MANEVTVRINIAGYERALRELSGVGGGVRELGGAVSSLKSILAGVSVGVILKDSLSQFEKLESATTDMAKVTTRELGAIKEEILLLDPALGNSTNLMQGYYQTISAGVADPAKALETLVGASKAASAAHVMQADVIRVSTKLMTGFQGAVQDVTQATDLLFAIEKEGQTTFKELVPVMGDLATVSNTVAVTQYELGGALSLLTQTSGSTAEAATKYKALLFSLIKPQENMNNLLEQMGYASGESIVAQEGLAGALEKIQIEAKKSGVKLGDLFESQEALMAISALSANSFENFKNKIAEVSKGAGETDRAFAAWEKTFEGVKVAFFSSINKISAELGESIAPTVSRVMKSLTSDFIEAQGKIKAFFDENRESINLFMKAISEGNENTVQYLHNIKTSLEAILPPSEKILKIIQDNPTIATWGLVGLMVGGVKGAVVMSSLAHMADVASTLGSALGLASAGVISFKDVATSNFKELDAIVKNFDESTKAFDLHPVLEKLRTDRDKITKEIKALQKILANPYRSEDPKGVSIFAQDWEDPSAKLKELEKQLEGINDQIARLRDFKKGNNSTETFEEFVWPAEGFTENQDLSGTKEELESLDAILDKVFSPDRVTEEWFQLWDLFGSSVPKECIVSIDEYNNALQQVKDSIASLSLSPQELAIYDLNKNFDELAKKLGAGNEELQRFYEINKQKIEADGIKAIDDALLNLTGSEIEIGIAKLNAQIAELSGVIEVLPADKVEETQAKLDKLRKEGLEKIYSKPIEDINAALDELTLSDRDQAIAALDRQMEAFGESIKDLPTDKLEEAEEALQKFYDAKFSSINSEADLKDIEARKNAYREMYQDLGTQDGQYFAEREKSLIEQEKSYEKLTKDTVTSEKWLVKKLEELNKEKTLAFGTFQEGVSLGFKELSEEQIKWGEVGYRIVEDFATQSHSALSDFFFDGSTDGFEDMCDSFKRTFADTLASLVQQALNNTIVVPVMQQMMGTAGLSTSNTGQNQGGSSMNMYNALGSWYNLKSGHNFFTSAESNIGGTWLQENYPETWDWLNTSPASQATAVWNAAPLTESGLIDYNTIYNTAWSDSFAAWTDAGSTFEEAAIAANEIAQAEVAATETSIVTADSSAGTWASRTGAQKIASALGVGLNSYEAYDRFKDGRYASGLYSAGTAAMYYAYPAVGAIMDWLDSQGFGGALDSWFGWHEDEWGLHLAENKTDKKISTRKGYEYSEAVDPIKFLEIEDLIDDIFTVEHTPTFRNRKVDEKILESVNDLAKATYLSFAESIDEFADTLPPTIKSKFLSDLDEIVVNFEGEHLHFSQGEFEEEIENLDANIRTDLTRAIAKPLNQAITAYAGSLPFQDKLLDDHSLFFDVDEMNSLVSDDMSDEDVNDFSELVTSVTADIESLSSVWYSYQNLVDPKSIGKIEYVYATANSAFDTYLKKLEEAGFDLTKLGDLEKQRLDVVKRAISEAVFTDITADSTGQALYDSVTSATSAQEAGQNFADWFTESFYSNIISAFGDMASEMFFEDIIQPFLDKTIQTTMDVAADTGEVVADLTSVTSSAVQKIGEASTDAVSAVLLTGEQATDLVLDNTDFVKHSQEAISSAIDATGDASKIAFLEGSKSAAEMLNEASFDMASTLQTSYDTAFESAQQLGSEMAISGTEAGAELAMAGSETGATLAMAGTEVNAEITTGAAIAETDLITGGEIGGNAVAIGGATAGGLLVKDTDEYNDTITNIKTLFRNMETIFKDEGVKTALKDFNTTMKDVGESMHDSISSTDARSVLSKNNTSASSSTSANGSTDVIDYLNAATTLQNSMVAYIDAAKQEQYDRQELLDDFASLSSIFLKSADSDQITSTALFGQEHNIPITDPTNIADMRQSIVDDVFDYIIDEFDMGNDPYALKNIDILKRQALSGNSISPVDLQASLATHGYDIDFDILNNKVSSTVSRAISNFIDLYGENIEGLILSFQEINKRDYQAIVDWFADPTNAQEVQSLISGMTEEQIESLSNVLSYMGAEAQELRERLRLSADTMRQLNETANQYATNASSDIELAKREFFTTNSAFLKGWDVDLTPEYVQDLVDFLADPKNAEQISDLREQYFETGEEADAFIDSILNLAGVFRETEDQVDSFLESIKELSGTYNVQQQNIVDLAEVLGLDPSEITYSNMSAWSNALVEDPKILETYKESVGDSKYNIDTELFYAVLSGMTDNDVSATDLAQTLKGSNSNAEDTARYAELLSMLFGDPSINSISLDTIATLQQFLIENKDAANAFASANPELWQEIVDLSGSVGVNLLENVSYVKDIVEEFNKLKPEYLEELDRRETIASALNVSTGDITTGFLENFMKQVEENESAVLSNYALDPESFNELKTAVFGEYSSLTSTLKTLEDLAKTLVLSDSKSPNFDTMSLIRDKYGFGDDGTVGEELKQAIIDGTIDLAGSQEMLAKANIFVTQSELLTDIESYISASDSVKETVANMTDSVEEGLWQLDATPLQQSLKAINEEYDEQYDTLELLSGAEQDLNNVRRLQYAEVKDLLSDTMLNIGASWAQLNGVADEYNIATFKDKYNLSGNIEDIINNFASKTPTESFQYGRENNIDIEAMMSELASIYSTMSGELETNLGDKKTTYLDLLQKELEAQEEILSNAQAMIDAYESIVDSLSDYKDQLLLDSPTLNPEAKYDLAFANWKEVVENIYSSDPEVSQEAMNDYASVSKDLLSASEEANVFAEDYLKDQAMVQAVLSSAQDIAEHQLSEQQNILDTAETEIERLEGIIDSVDKTADAIQSLEEAAQEYYDAQNAYNNTFGTNVLAPSLAKVIGDMDSTTDSLASELTGIDPDNLKTSNSADTTLSDTTTKTLTDTLLSDTTGETAATVEASDSTALTFEAQEDILNAINVIPEICFPQLNDNIAALSNDVLVPAIEDLTKAMWDDFMMLVRHQQLNSNLHQAKEELMIDYLTTLTSQLTQLINSSSMIYSALASRQTNIINNYYYADSYNDSARYRSVTPRASGGDVSSGLYLVGEDGPELLDLGGAGYVSNNSDTKENLKNISSKEELKELIVEIKDLKNIIKQLAGGTKQNTTKMLRILDKIDAIGVAERVA